MNPASPSRAFVSGFRGTLPMVSGVVPFGLLYATLATNAGLPWWLTLYLSVAVFGGTSQLVFIDLLRALGSPLQAGLGANIVNARHLIYSAGVSEFFAPFPFRWRFTLSYLLTDQLFAFAETRTEEARALPLPVRPWLYFGSGFCTWFFWIASTLLGAFFGRLIPADWNLAFAIPLTFMPLVFGVAKDRFGAGACLLAAALVCLLRPLPFGLGIFSAILLASLGAFAWRRHELRGRK